MMLDAILKNTSEIVWFKWNFIDIEMSVRIHLSRSFIQMISNELISSYEEDGNSVKHAGISKFDWNQKVTSDVKISGK